MFWRWTSRNNLSHILGTISNKQEINTKTNMTILEYVVVPSLNIDTLSMCCALISVGASRTHNRSIPSFSHITPQKPRYKCAQNGLTRFSWSSPCTKSALMKPGTQGAAPQKTARRAFLGVTEGCDPKCWEYCNSIPYYHSHIGNIYLRTWIP